MSESASKMTGAERETIRKSLMFCKKVVEDDCEAQGARMLADGEAKLAAAYKFEDEAWAHITATASKVIQEADAAIAKICRERGIPEDFRPKITLGWYERGLNASKAHRAEVRRVLETEIAARVKQAKTRNSRETEALLRQLISGSLTSDAAKAFLENMPTVEQLITPITSLKMHDGEIVFLEGEKRNPLLTVVEGEALVTPERNGVTVERNAVTQGGVNTNCAACGKPIAIGRGLYCSKACRQKAYRQRHSTGRPQQVAVTISVMYRDSDDYGEGEHWEHLGDVETQEAAVQLRNKHMRENRSTLCDYRILDQNGSAEGV
jgi:hypothetical protein